MADLRDDRVSVRKGYLDQLAQQAGGLSAGMAILYTNLIVTMDTYGDDMPPNVRSRMEDAINIVETYRDKYDVI